MIGICIRCNRERHICGNGLCHSCKGVIYYLKHKKDVDKVQRAWRADNREKMRAYYRNYWREHPEKYDKLKEQMRIRYKNNPKSLEKKRAYDREYYRRNK